MMRWVGDVRTMLPAWSRKPLPLVFIILRYGLLNVFTPKPDVCSQGSDMSLSMIWTSVSDTAWNRRRWSPQKALWASALVFVEGQSDQGLLRVTHINQTLLSGRGVGAPRKRRAVVVLKSNFLHVDVTRTLINNLWLFACDVRLNASLVRNLPFVLRQLALLSLLALNFLRALLHLPQLPLPPLRLPLLTLPVHPSYEAPRQLAHVGREEVALDGRYAPRRLRGDEVDAEDFAAGLCAFDGDLFSSRAGPRKVGVGMRWHEAGNKPGTSCPVRIPAPIVSVNERFLVKLGVKQDRRPSVLA
jgi:hypothetical protein